MKTIIVKWGINWDLHRVWHHMSCLHILSEHPKPLHRDPVPNYGCCQSMDVLGVLKIEAYGNGDIFGTRLIAAKADSSPFYLVVAMLIPFHPILVSSSNMSMLISYLRPRTYGEAPLGVASQRRSQSRGWQGKRLTRFRCMYPYDSARWYFIVYITPWGRGLFRGTCSNGYKPFWLKFLAPKLAARLL